VTLAILELKVFRVSKGFRVLRDRRGFRVKQV
jgi:hypothetical protein